MRLPYWTEQLALEGPIKAEKAFCQKKDPWVTSCIMMPSYPPSEGER